MLLSKPFRKVAAIFRGEVSPLAIMLSVLLGFWFGATPGWHGIHLAMALVAILLSTHKGIFMLAAGAGAAISLGAAPLFYHTGVWVQEQLPGLIQSLAALPVIGATDFSRCSVAGALLIGPAVGLLAGLVLAKTVHGFRHMWISLEDNSDAFRNWQSKSWVRWMDWLLWGRRAQDVRSVIQRKPRLIRVSGVVGLTVVLAVSVGVATLLRDLWLRDMAADALTRANGATVDIASLDLDIFGAALKVTGLQMTDPAKPAQNRVAVEELNADVSVMNLLRGRLIVDQVTLSGVRLDQTRDNPGVVVLPPDDSESPPFDMSRFKLPDVSPDDVTELANYYENAKAVRQKLAELSQWLPAPGEEPPPAMPPQSYLDYFFAHSSVAPAPKVIVRHLAIDEIDLAIDHLGVSRLEVHNISDAPTAAGLPVTIKIDSKQYKSNVALVSHYESPAQGAELTGRLEGVDLAKFQQSLSQRNPVVLDGGTADVNLSGLLSRETIDLAINVQTHDMQTRVTGSKVIGLDSGTAAEAMKALRDMKVMMRVIGPTARPRIVFDGKATADAMRDALVAAGKKELANQLTKSLGGKMPEGVPGVDKALENPLDAAKEGLGGFLNQSLNKDKDKKRN